MKTFIVLGMHRSASSLIAKGLNENHVWLGDKLLPASPPSNMFGHFEDLDFVNLNEKILRHCGGTWDHPPTEEAILNSKRIFSAEIENLIRTKEKRAIVVHKDLDQEIYKEPLWGWKDPRTTLTIKLYLPFLTNPHFICCFREPKELIRSVIERNGLSSDWENVVNVYHERLIKLLSEEYLVTTPVWM